jgi:DNA-binding CsgD family transcriptional regulator
VKHRELRPRRLQSFVPLDALFDRLSAPALLVDRTGVLRRTNFAGTEALRRAQYLVLRNGRVRPRNVKQERQFLDMLSTVLPDDPTTTASQQSFTMRLLGVEGQVVVLLTQRLRAQMNLGRMPQADAVLFLIRPNEKAQITTIRLQIVFGLTPAETRLAEYLICGMGLAGISEQLHLSRETLKTQLRFLFRKTGTNRQGELIARLLSSIEVSVT